MTRSVFSTTQASSMVQISIYQIAMHSAYTIDCQWYCKKKTCQMA